MKKRHASSRFRVIETPAGWVGVDTANSDKIWTTPLGTADEAWIVVDVLNEAARRGWTIVPTAEALISVQPVGGA